MVTPLLSHCSDNSGVEEVDQPIKNIFEAAAEASCLIFLVILLPCVAVNQRCSLTFSDKKSGFLYHRASFLGVSCNILLVAASSVKLVEPSTFAA